MQPSEPEPGPFIGILMLDTRFDRIVGDVGNPATYPFAVRLETVPNADPTQVVRAGRLRADLLSAFTDAARHLQDQGAIGLISSCGFLINAQPELAASVDIPVMASSLVLAPAIRAAHGNRPIGIVTANADALDSAALAVAGLDAQDVTIGGLQNEPAFANVFLSPRDATTKTVDTQKIGVAAANAARAIVDEQPHTGAIIIECGNLPPYRNQIAKAAQRPVYDIVDCAMQLWRAGGGDAHRIPTRFD